LLCSALAWQRKEKCLARTAFIESAARDVKKNALSSAFGELAKIFDLEPILLF